MLLLDLPTKDTVPIHTFNNVLNFLFSHCCLDPRVCVCRGCGGLWRVYDRLRRRQDLCFQVLCRYVGLYTVKIQTFSVQGGTALFGHQVQKNCFALIKKIFLQPLVEIISRYH